MTAASARSASACDGTAAAILAGGKSRRMGRPKAFIELEGRPLIARVIDVVGGLFPEVFIVSSDPGPLAGLGLPVIPDRRPGAGPLAGAHAALAAAKHSQVLVVGCDMPFLCPALLAHLAARAKGHDAAVPRGADGLHPLHAVYARRALVPIAAALEDGTRKFADAILALDRIEIGEEEMRRHDPDLLSLFNVNRPEDLARARALIEARRATGGPARPVRQDV